MPKLILKPITRNRNGIGRDIETNNTFDMERNPITSSSSDLNFLDFAILFTRNCKKYPKKSDPTIQLTNGIQLLRLIIFNSYLI